MQQLAYSKRKNLPLQEISVKFVSSNFGESADYLKIPKNKLNDNFKKIIITSPKVTVISRKIGTRNCKHIKSSTGPVNK